MANPKSQKEVDKAIRHLMDYIDKSKHWAPLFDGMIDQLVAPVANHLGQDLESVLEKLLTGPYADMAFRFLYEEMACALWNGSDRTPIDEFLRKRGSREGTHGRRYLRALQETRLSFFEITNVEPGKWIEVRTYGTNEHSRRILERSASESLRQWDAIVARVIATGKTHRFTSSILPLSPNAAKYVQEELEAVPEYLAELYQEIVDDGDAEGITEHLVDEIEPVRMERLTENSFMCWAIDALDPPGAPQLHNTDDELIVPSKFRFPVTGDITQIRECLSACPDLLTDKDDHWTWLKSAENNTVLGHIKLDQDQLVFETNSVERGERGRALVESLLGEVLVGPPIGVHQNMGDLLASMPADDPSSMPSADLQAMPEVQDMLQETLKAHYLKTLDESVPMLDNDSPRTCAADPTKHDKVVAWLKYLESMDGKSPGPAQDFAWMWEELGLAEYRQVEIE